MAQTFKGKATIHGLVDVGVISGSTFPASLEPQEAGFDRTADLYDLRDRTGARVGVIFYDTTDAATITLVVQATSIANKDTSAAAFNGFLPGAKITFTLSGGSKPNVWTSGTTQDWLVKSWSVSQSNTDALKITVQVEKYPGIASYDNVV